VVRSQNSRSNRAPHARKRAQTVKEGAQAGGWQRRAGQRQFDLIQICRVGRFDVYAFESRARTADRRLDGGKTGYPAIHYKNDGTAPPRAIEAGRRAVAGVWHRAGS